MKAGHPNTLPGHSEGLWHFALNDFFFFKNVVFHNIRPLKDLLLKVAFQTLKSKRWKGLLLAGSSFHEPSALGN